MEKIAIVANNYGQKHDGIGAYSKVISENFSGAIKYDVYSSICKVEDGRISRVLNLGMCKCLLCLIKNIKKYSTVIVEYPFMEWNPLIVFFFMYLKRISKINNKRIVLSLHEYDRVNFLRKAVIRIFVKNSDLVIVSNKKTLDLINKHNINIKIRDIPTNIYGEATLKREQSMYEYVYFGLINKSKAFKEMMDGWDRFNCSDNNTLYVISGSKLDDIESKHRNVKYIYNADNDAVFSILNRCMFCVLPIKPEIDEKNATFKSGVLAGCICIGKFSEQYKNKEFIINMDGYKENDFYNAFKASKLMEYEKAILHSEMAVNYGKIFTPKMIAQVIEEYLVERQET